MALASKKNTGRKTVVMQSKVERQNDRIDAVTGLGRSKGYGFLEMRSHQDALKVLRWANNNPGVSALMKEWVSVELEELAAREKEKLLKAREAVPKPDDLDDQELKYKKLMTKVKEGVAGLTDGMKQGKTLLVEFSVENVQVVKRRSEKMSQGGEAGAKPERERSRKRKVSLAPQYIGEILANAVPQAEHDSEDEDAAPRGDKTDKLKDRKRGGGGKGKDKRPSASNGDDAAKSPRANKKARRDGDGAEKAVEGKDKSLGKNLGGLIGKKRKMRKAGGK